MSDIKPNDIVKCRAITSGFDGIALRDAGEYFQADGKIFQNGMPSWIEVLEVYETEKKQVEQVVIGKKKAFKE